MAVYRVQRTSAVTLQKRFAIDEVPTDATGDVTVTVRRLDNTVVTSGVAAHPGETGLYTFLLPAQANVDILTVDWACNLATVRDVAEIVGGFIFDLGTARSRYKLPVAKYSASHLAARRTQVEQECESICGWAWVPRFDREVLSGDYCDSLLTKQLMLRSVRAVIINGVALTSGELANVVATEAGVIIRRYSYWPWGIRNIVVEYEHGFDVPAQEVTEMAMFRLQTLLSVPDTIVDERAISYSIADGGVYRLALPAAKKTGVPSIDAAYERNGLQVGAFA